MDEGGGESGESEIVVRAKKKSWRMRSMISSKRSRSSPRSCSSNVSFCPLEGDLRSQGPHAAANLLG